MGKLIHKQFEALQSNEKNYTADCMSLLNMMECWINSNNYEYISHQIFKNVDNHNYINIILSVVAKDNNPK